MIDLKTQVLQAIADRHDGHLPPDQVVESARHPLSPLHDYFEWDDAKAGDAYRLQQARALIRSVRIEVRSGTSTVVAPLFVRNPDLPPKQQGYVTIARLVKSEDSARAAVLAEFGRVAAALERAKAVAAAVGLVEEIDALLASVSLVQARLSPADTAERVGH